MVKSKGKTASKKKTTKKTPNKGSRGKGSKVEFKKREPKTKQKTVRVPVYLLEWLQSEAAKVPISVPAAIVQILEKAYQNDRRKKTREAKSA